MPQDNLFAGIDIGSNAVRIAVGQRLAAGEGDSVHIIGAAEVPSVGINRGVINSIEDAVSTVSSCLEKIERLTGVPVESAWVSISGANVIALESKGVVVVSRPDGEIRVEDAGRAIEQAQAVATPVNFEIIHVLPKTFTVDGQAGIKDPVGMTGVRLEVDAKIIQGLSSHVKNLTKCVYRTGVNIEDLVLGILAAADVVVTPRQKELGVAVVNLGGATTTVVVYEQGDVLHLASLPIGSDYITNDIAIGLRTSLDIAERVKLGCANARARDLNKRDEINLRDLGADADETVSLKYVAEIVQARLEEILEKIDQELKKVSRSGLLPAGVVLTGGGAKLPGLVELAKSKLRLPVSLGYPLNVTSATNQTTDPSFTTAIGLVRWGANTSGLAASRSGLLAKYRPVEKVTKQMKKWLGGLFKS